MDPYDYNSYAAEYNYNNPYVQGDYSQEQAQAQPEPTPSPFAGVLDQRLPNPRDENARLREVLELLKRSEERAKAKVTEYIYQNELEKQSLSNKIKFLRDQIAGLRVDLGVDKMSLNAGESGELQLDEEGEIKAGSQEKLIEALYVDYGKKTLATEYANVFLLTYRVFATPAQLLDRLMAAYVKNSKAGPANDATAVCRLKIGNFIKRWLSDAYHDWDDEMSAKFDQFVNNNIKKVDPKLAEALIRALQDKQKGDNARRQSTIIFSEPPPPPIVPKVTQITSMIDIHPQEIARQLTLIDYELSKRIETKEFLGMAWTKKDKEKRSPNLLHFISRFNMVSKWVAYSVCAEPNLKKRAKIVSHIVDILKHLKELNNFNGIFQIVGGLGNASVYRLTKTFEAAKDRKKDLEALRFLTKPEKSWANYRKELHGMNPPCVPFLGVYQTDLTFIEDGNPDKFSTGLWNFKKCRLIGSVINEVNQYQRKPYNLQSCLPVFNWLMASQEAAKQIDDKKLYELSLEAEPREQS